MPSFWRQLNKSSQRAAWRCDGQTVSVNYPPDRQNEREPIRATLRADRDQVGELVRELRQESWGGRPGTPTDERPASVPNYRRRQLRMNQEPKVRILPLSSLSLDEQNANRGSERGRKMLADSLRKLGAGRSVLVDREGRVIAGNKTV